MGRLATRVTAFALMSLVPSLAQAYCRQTTNTDDTCGANPGIPLLWEGNCVPYTVHQAGSDDLSLDVVRDRIAKSFEVWEDASTDDGPCSYLTFFETEELATCDKVEFSREGGNMNLIVFRESGWATQYNHASAAMGLTTVFFDPPTGQILSADMELNGENFRFTVDDIRGEADLLNTVTHEAGHVLGLAHSRERLATMWQSSESGETLKRNLHPDDIEAVCTMYPTDADPGRCYEEPIGGLDPACKPPSDDGCSCRAAGVPIQTGPLSGLLLAVAAAVRWRRR